jgi:hypothetical protein
VTHPFIRPPSRNRKQNGPTTARAKDFKYVVASVALFSFQTEQRMPFIHFH